MKEHGILFTAPMVRAILAGQKTQTRRLVKPQPIFQPSTVSHAPHGPVGRRLWVRETWSPDGASAGEVYPCPYAWYRADFGSWDDPLRDCMCRPRDPAQCLACWRKEYGFKWRPSIHMPRWASRITLKVTRVRVERVQAITMADVKAEGVRLPVTAVGKTKVQPLIEAATPYEKSLDGTWTMADYWRSAYACLWEKINGRGSWAANPWVWVYDFRRVA